MQIKALLYCAKSKPTTLYNVLGKFITTEYLGDDFMQDGYTHPELNGKIAAECDFEVETIVLGQGYFSGNGMGYFRRRHGFPDKELEECSCISYKELDECLLGLLHENCGYAINFKNLHIFDIPMKLRECHTRSTRPDGFSYNYTPLKTGPSNMKQVWVKVNGGWVMYILISFDPESLCKILNKKKTIEPRATVLKEMLPAGEGVEEGEE